MKRQYELVNKQIGETTGSTTTLEREKLKLEQRITNTESVLEKQEQELGETKDRLGTAHFADVLAAAEANSNTNISIMGETFKRSSSVAGALEDVAMMVGLMANNSVKGSRAGTVLRNIFNGLLDGVTLAAKAFGEPDYSAVNLDGFMKGLMAGAGAAMALGTAIGRCHMEVEIRRKEC